MEVLLRYADELFVKTGKSPDLASAYRDMMAYVLDNVPSIVHHKPNDFREEMANSDELHNEFKKHEPWLRLVFNHMCSDSVASARKSGEITLKSFENLMHKDLQITSEVRLDVVALLDLLT